MSKRIANEILGAHERHSRGECTRDRALEDISKIINDYADKRYIAGYVKSGALRNALSKVITSAKAQADKSYMFDAELHRNDLDDLKRIYESTFQRVDLNERD